MEEHRPALAVVGVHQVEAVVQGGQHAQAEQVELDQARVGAVVLVPLQHGTPRHPRPLHRAHLPHRPVADHHAARVDAEVPRQPLHPRGQLRHRVGRAGRQRFGVRGRPRSDLADPGVRLRGREPECAAGVPQRHPRPVRDHVGDLGGPVPPVLAVDVLDDLLAAAVLDVQVDVRRPVPAVGKEPLEQQVVRDRVDVGDAEREADRRVRRRPAALAQDVVVLAELDDVVHDQEVASERQPLDHVELPGDLGVRAGHPFGTWRPVAGRGLARDQLAQPGGFGVPGRDTEVGQARGDHVEVERALAAQLDGALEHARVPAQPRGHLLARPQVGGARRGQPAVHVGQAAAGPDRGQRLAEPGLRGRREVDVAGRHHAEVGQRGQPGQHVVALVVARVVLAGQLDHHVLVPEHLGQRPQLPPGRLRTARGERGGHRPLAAAGQHHPVAVVRAGQFTGVVERAALLPARQLGGADHGAQPPVALRVAGQHQQVTALRDPGDLGLLPRRQAEAQLGAEHRAQPGALAAEPGGGLRELRHPVHAVVVGEGEHLQPEPGRLGDQLAGGGRPVEEAERGVAVQFGPWDAGGRAGRPRPGSRAFLRRRMAWPSPRSSGAAAPARGPAGYPTPLLSAPLISSPPRPATGRPGSLPATPARRRWPAGTGPAGARRPGPTSARTAARGRPSR